MSSIGVQGQFQEYWEAAGIKSGDILTFERNNPSVGKIRTLRYPQGRGLEQALASSSGIEAPAPVQPAAAPAAPSSTPSFHPGSSSRSTTFEEVAHGAPGSTSGSMGAPQPQVTCTRAPHVQHTGHQNRWMELPDGSSVKTIYKSTLVHQQCPIAGWLFKKVRPCYVLVLRFQLSRIPISERQSQPFPNFSHAFSVCSCMTGSQLTWTMPS